MFFFSSVNFGFALVFILRKYLYDEALDSTNTNTNHKFSLFKYIIATSPRIGQELCRFTRLLIPFFYYYYYYTFFFLLIVNVAHEIQRVIHVTVRVWLHVNRGSNV
jgi:hypothetical protein